MKVKTRFDTTVLLELAFRNLRTAILHYPTRPNASVNYSILLSFMYRQTAHPHT